MSEADPVIVAAIRMADAAQNFARRFSMQALPEDDDRQRQAVLDQVRLFRAKLAEAPPDAAEQHRAALTARLEGVERAIRQLHETFERRIRQDADAQRRLRA